jgi:hypothetical protein
MYLTISVRCAFSFIGVAHDFLKMTSFCVLCAVMRVPLPAIVAAHTGITRTATLEDSSSAAGSEAEAEAVPIVHTPTTRGCAVL